MSQQDVEQLESSSHMKEEENPVWFAEAYLVMLELWEPILTKRDATPEVRAQVETLLAAHVSEHKAEIAEIVRLKRRQKRDPRRVSFTGETCH